MEKVIITLRTGSADDDWAQRLRGPIADQLLALDVPGLTINVRDADVRDALMTLTTLDPPVQGFVTLWTQQYYGEQVRAALDLLAGHADQVAAYLVTESAPMPAPVTAPGERTAALANIALLRRAEDAGLLPAGVGQAAADAYRALRRVQHRARLDEQPTQVAPDTLAGERAAIQRLWQVVFE